MLNRNYLTGTNLISAVNHPKILGCKSSRMIERVCDQPAHIFKALFVLLKKKFVWNGPFTSHCSFCIWGIDKQPSRQVILSESLKNVCFNINHHSQLIRIQRIEHLNLVPGLKNVNFKVIHLIRDPRGTMNSRKGFPSFYIDVSSQEIIMKKVVQEIKLLNLSLREIICNFKSF